MVVATARRSAASEALAFGAAQSAVASAASLDVRWEAVTAAGPEGSVVTMESSRAPPPPPLTLEGALATGTWKREPAAKGMRVTPRADGSLQVEFSDVEVEVEEVSDTTWIIRERPDEDATGEVLEEQGEVDINAMFDLEKRLDELIQNLVSTSNERLADLIAFAQKLVVGVVGLFVGMLLTLMVAGFISIDLPRVMGFIRSLFPLHMREGYDILLSQLDRGLAGVVRGQLLICVVNGTLTYIGLAIFGIKFRVLLAVVAGVFSLIPVFGTVLSTIPIVLIGLTQGVYQGVAALGWILFIHALEANLLNPKIIGSSAHIHPVIVIFALLAGESAYGLVGALLAVPTASILLTLFNFVRTRAWTQAKAREPEPSS